MIFLLQILSESITLSSYFKLICSILALCDFCQTYRIPHQLLKTSSHSEMKNEPQFSNSKKLNSIFVIAQTWKFVSETWKWSKSFFNRCHYSDPNRNNSDHNNATWTFLKAFFAENMAENISITNKNLNLDILVWPGDMSLVPNVTIRQLMFEFNMC